MRFLLSPLFQLNLNRIERKWYRMNSLNYFLLNITNRFVINDSIKYRIDYIKEIDSFFNFIIHIDFLFKTSLPFFLEKIGPKLIQFKKSVWKLTVVLTFTVLHNYVRSSCTPKSLNARFGLFWRSKWVHLNSPNNENSQVINNIFVCKLYVQ